MFLEEKEKKNHCSFSFVNLVGLPALELQFLIDLLKTWHFQLQGLYRKEDPLSIITW